MKYWRQVFAVILALVVSACGGAGSAPEIEVQDPWARAAGMGGHGQEGGEMSGMNGAAYMLLENRGGAVDRLLRVNSDVAEADELHISVMKDGVMSMSPVEFIVVPAGGTTELKPGGLHVMLIGLKRALKPGDTVNLILEFETSGSIIIEAEVRAP